MLLQGVECAEVDAHARDATDERLAEGRGRKRRVVSQIRLSAVWCCYEGGKMIYWTIFTVELRHFHTSAESLERLEKKAPVSSH